MEGPAYRSSPHLGGDLEFHFLVLKITCFSRQDHGHEHRARGVGAWLSRPDHLGYRLRDYYDKSPQAIGEWLRAKYTLYSVTLRMYCLKVRDHELCASNPEIGDLVWEVTKIYKEGRRKGSYAAVIPWPLLVVLCACPDRDTFRFSTRHVKHIETTFDRGHLRRLAAVVTKLHRKFERRANHAKDQDNFGMLLYKQGLIVTSLETALLHTSIDITHGNPRLNTYTCPPSPGRYILLSWFAF